MIETTIRRLLRPIVELRERETTLTVLMFSYSFLAMAGYNIIKPATRSKFIASLGAENLPYVMLIAGLLMGVIMQQYGRMVSRLPRRWMFPGTQAALVGLLLVFWALFKTDQPWVSAAFYFWGLLLGIFLISQFWSLANDVYDARQAKRLFGFIGGGASLGGTAGAALTVWLAQPLGTDDLLLVSAGVLAVGTGVSWYLTHRTDAGNRSAAVAVPEAQVGGKEALHLLRESRHLRLIALIIGFAAMGAVILEQQLNMATEAFIAGEDAVTSFLASITLYISAIAFVVQIWLTGRIHRFLGVGFALLVLPVSLAVTSSLILLFPVVWIAAIARVQDSSLRYTLDKTSREILFVPLPADLKHKAKPFVDVAVDRLMGKGLASILLLLLLKVFDFEWYQLSYVSLAMVGAWIVMAVQAKREYIAGFRRRLAQGSLTSDELVLLSADLSTVEILVGELASQDEQRVLHAIDLLEFLGQPHFVTPLLLQHRAGSVRARTLRVLASAPSKAGEEWLPAVESCLADGLPEVRAAALAALGAIKGSAPDVMRAHLADPDPEIVAMAARTLAESGRHDDVDASLHVLSRLIDDSRDTARAAVARALGDSLQPALRRLLVPLLLDGREEVARVAIASARRVTDTDRIFLPILVSLLARRRLKQAARAALATYGPDALPVLGHFLQDADEAPWTRRHLPVTIARIPCQESVDLLLTVLNDADQFVRFKAMVALAELHRERPDLRMDPKPIEGRAAEEAVRATRYWRAYGDLFGGDPRQHTLLASALRQNVAHAVGRIYDLLGLMYPWRDIAAVRWTLEHGDAAARTAGAEYLDNLLKVGARRRLMPLIEDVAFDRVPDTREGTVETTLADLIIDEDSIVATAAVAEVVARQSWGLAPILEKVASQDAANRRQVSEAATWALTSGRTPSLERRGPLAPIEIADRLHKLPLFREAAIGELLQVAALGRQASLAVGERLADTSHVVLLLQGTARVEVPDGGGVVHAPALLGLREALEGRERSPARAEMPSIGLLVERDVFLTVLSNNVALIDGLARMLLESTAKGGKPAVVRPAGRTFRTRSETGSLKPVEKALLLREVPIFSGATTADLAETASIAREVPLVPGARLFSEYDPSTLYVIVSGELVLVRADSADTFRAEAGDIVGAYAPLAGPSSGWRADVLQGGAALALTRDDLFELLADRVDLLRGVFSILFQTERFRSVHAFSAAS